MANLVYGKEALERELRCRCLGHDSRGYWMVTVQRRASRLRSLRAEKREGRFMRRRVRETGDGGGVRVDLGALAFHHLD